MRERKHAIGLVVACGALLAPGVFASKPDQGAPPGTGFEAGPGEACPFPIKALLSEENTRNCSPAFDAATPAAR